MYYNLVSDTNGKTLTLIFSDGDTTPVSSDHPRYDEIFSAVNDDSLSEDDVRGMVDIVGQVGDHLTALSERVSLSGNSLLFDGDPLRGEISEHILNLVREGDDRGWRGLVNFLEKAQTNPNEHSRDSLYSWINGRNITITQDGDLIAYKGVRVTEDGENESISHGTATVNGKVYKGAIPNPLGAVVEMPRSQVQHDTAVGCSTGLHAGTWEYASSFSRQRVLTVRINPRDVVSVPTDCEAQKMRVSRYEVLSEVDQELTSSTLYYTDSEDVDQEEYENDEPDYVFCEWCGDSFDYGDLDDEGSCQDCAEEGEQHHDDEDERDEDYSGYLFGI